MKTGMALLLVFLTATGAGAEALPTASTLISAPTFSKDVFAAARHAARDQKVTIVRIRSADVADDNSIRLCMFVRTDMLPFRAAVTVSRNGRGQFALTRWYPGGC